MSGVRVECTFDVVGDRHVRVLPSQALEGVVVGALYQLYVVWHLVLAVVVQR